MLVQHNDHFWMAMMGDLPCEGRHSVGRHERWFIHRDDGFFQSRYILNDGFLCIAALMMMGLMLELRGGRQPQGCNWTIERHEMRNLELYNPTITFPKQQRDCLYRIECTGVLSFWNTISGGRNNLPGITPYSLTHFP